MNTKRIHRPAALCDQLGIAVSTLYDWTSPNSPRFDPTFPKKIKLGPRAIGFDPTEVETWLAKKSDAR